MLRRSTIASVAVLLGICAAASIAAASVPKVLILEHFADYFG